jgi:hypothetical protein
MLVVWRQFTSKQEWAMREKQFTLSRTQHEAMWCRFKQTDDRRVAKRLHAILLLDDGQNAETASRILHVHPKTLKRWVKAFASGGSARPSPLDRPGHPSCGRPPPRHPRAAGSAGGSSWWVRS